MLPAILASLLFAAPTAAAAKADEPVAAMAKPHRKKGKPAVDGVLNVNRASEAELRLLPGIGKKRAELIVERRTQKPFANLDELARLKGMKSIVRKNRAHLSVQGDTTLHPAAP